MGLTSRPVGQQRVYAGLHFIQRIKIAEPIDWTSGFVALGLMLGLEQLRTILSRVLKLALAGIALGLGYQRTGASIFRWDFAGWIFWLKSYGFLTRRSAGSVWLWGQAN